MYTLVRDGTRGGLAAEALACGLAVIVAEWLYKFHSFTLECLCFLLTWAAFSAAIALTARWWAPMGNPVATSEVRS